MIVVVNKCDYLTQKQRQIWHEYFKSVSHGLEHVFFSAMREQEILDSFASNNDDIGTIANHDNNGVDDNDDIDQYPEYMAVPEYPTILNPSKIGITNPLARRELIDVLSKYAHIKGVTIPNDDNELEKDEHEGRVNFQGKITKVNKSKRIEFGMVGFPNVGKSSVLNVLVGSSKNNHKVHRVGVAAMPGKTKHFQTLNIPDYSNITLVDCPGLVFPSFVSSSADLVLAGVYPLSQVRDFWPSIELICQRIPRNILEAYFGIQISNNKSSVSTMTANYKHRSDHGIYSTSDKPSAEEFLRSYCIARSLLAPSSGVPDYYRASQVVLKDYVHGALLYFHSPPQLPTGKDSNLFEKPTNTLITTSHPQSELDIHYNLETLSTMFRKEVKLREKLGVIKREDGTFASNRCNNTKSKLKESRTSINKDESCLDYYDDDFFNFDKIPIAAHQTGGRRGKAHKSRHKHGKKGRKQRNKDPYGCHQDPDEGLLSQFNEVGGLVVNAGKYGSKNYTRLSYRGARSAT